MGSLLRSEPMTLCQLFLPTDVAFVSVAQLGELGLCQFRDMNPEVSSYQRKYVMEVRRCDEMERKLRYFENELLKAEVSIPDAGELIATPMPNDMNDLESKFEKLDDELQAINQSIDSLRHNYVQLSDMRQVLIKMQILLDEGGRDRAVQSISEAEQGLSGPLCAPNGYTPSAIGEYYTRQQPRSVNSELNRIGSREETSAKIGDGESELKFLAGIIRSDKVRAFERVLWRMCHGKVHVRTLDADEGNQGETPFPDEFKKSVFVVFFFGSKLQTRVQKISDAFHASVVEDYSESAVKRAELLQSVVTRLEDMGTVVGKTQEYQDRVLQIAALNIKKWEIQVLKLKSIFHTLNCFNIDVTQKCLISECWIPSKDLFHIRSALQYASEMSGGNVPSILNKLDPGSSTPPTYHRLNKFTQAFQNIVDSYGIASYQEINPAPWTIITFPFIFAVMFGDVGHGLIMLASAAALVAFEAKIEAAKIRDEIFNIFYGGRYVILMMGCFAVYTGLIYNDCFCKSINLFGSGWKNPYDMRVLNGVLEQEISTGVDIRFDLPPEFAFEHDKGPYVFGLDPVWDLSENRLNFLNPMKMKSSIIIGVSQMLFGLVLSLFNHLHHHSLLDIYFVFLPQLLFLCLIFVYLCFQIIIKWIVFWVKPGYVLAQFYPGSHCAPSLLIGLINMFMMKSRVQGFAHQDSNSTDSSAWIENAQCGLQLWYPHQDIVEMFFLLVAIFCIPVLLLVKPLVLRRRAKNGEVVVKTTGHGEGEGSGEFNFGDVMVYQAIHTIEFALGCVSHTASYLRLWALSLAHAQLSEVLWTMVLRQGLSIDNTWVAAVANYVIFFFFAILSISVLVLMEGLSAFLHALRLHWVEFQSKFYNGTGIPFEPFSFAKTIRLHEGFDS